MHDSLSRLSVALADRYRITGEVGAGGMATVYTAEDLKHGRTVALKVLKPELAAAIGSERFLQEIKVTAKLQHPHILALFDSGEADGFLYYVMPFVQGESLRARLEREKQLPIADAVRVTAEVAGALDYAHRQGIIHRDIKPENILLHDGQALVADFGIALALQVAGGPRLTATGLSLGTPLYMSPEQATANRELDARTDVYSLGVVLYEMLAGEPPHRGSSVQAVIASVVADEPESILTHRKTVPPRVAGAIEVALQKLPADRFPSAEAFAQALTGQGPWVGPTRAVSAVARPWLRDRRSWAALAIAATAVLAAVVRVGGKSSSVAAPARFDVMLPDEEAFGVSGVTPPAISPDGSVIVYGAVIRDSAGPTRRQLFARPLDQVEPVPIAGTDGGSAPFFSPDGRSIGFWVGARIEKVPVTGGTPITLVDSASPFFESASWGASGKIVFPIASDALAEVDQAGGTPHVIYRDSSRVVVDPTMLPRGKEVMFLRCLRSDCGERQEIAIVDPATGAVRVAQGAGVFRMVRYLPSGLVLYVRGDLLVYADAELVAAPFDLERGLVGEAVPVEQHVLGFAVSGTGTLVTVAAAASRNELVRVGADGVEHPLAEYRREYLFPTVSPDGRRVAMEIHDASGGQIWVYDTTSKTLTKLTTHGHNSRPVWSPDGTRIAYSSSRDTASGIYSIPADGSGPEVRIGIASPDLSFATVSWFPDGRRILYGERLGPESPGLSYTVAAVRDSVPSAVSGLPSGAGTPRLSPDGRWLAYTSGESGRSEVYVRPYPGPGGRWVVSMNGGSEPEWAPSGHRLYYVGADGWLDAATLVLGHDVRISSRAHLFDAQPYANAGYAVFPDGAHFVFVREDRHPPEVQVVLNWFTELSRRLRGITPHS